MNAAMVYAQQAVVVTSLQQQLALAEGMLAAYYDNYQQAALILADSGCGG